jgi:hypothetical protein
VLGYLLDVLDVLDMLNGVRRPLLLLPRLSNNIVRLVASGVPSPSQHSALCRRTTTLRRRGLVREPTGCQGSKVRRLPWQ